ncbi:MAG TPA: hypothetical protein VKD91_08835 [Pyrinomonadaceae bacterium]|nr:hypothetical protein [Pyrinomonadaceae bacterium]
MAEILIQHCKLRIIRRDGWSWGPEPQKILQTAIRRLPELIARQLEGLWPEGADFEIAAPVRIKVPVRMSELLAIGESLPVEDSATSHPPHSALSARFGQSIKAAFEPVCQLPDESSAAEVLRSASGAFDGASLQFNKTPFGRPNNVTSQVTQPESTSGGGAAWSRLLLSWREQGVLVARLELLSLTTLETWHRKLLEFDSRREPESSPDSSQAIERLLGEIFDELPAAAPGGAADSSQRSTAASSAYDLVNERAAILRRRILALVELTARSQAMPGNRKVQELLDRAFPLSVAPTTELEALGIASAPDSSAMDRASEAVRRDEEDVKAAIPFQIADATAARPESATRKPAAQFARRIGGVSLTPLFEGEAYVHSALPFLLLRPLAQLEYFEALRATLESAELADQAPLFASALAYKALDAPERGWLRRTEILMASAVFAGLAEPVSDTALEGFAKRVSDHLSPLDAAITGALIEGHNSNQPLLLWETDREAGGGWLLVDLEGLFPVAWAEEPSGLLPALRGCGKSLLLIPQIAADSTLLKRLDDGGFSFITDAPPTRGEHWRRLRGQASGRWWTNDRTGSDSTLMRAAQQLTSAAEETEAMWKALAVDRRSIPRAPESAFERSLTLTAATGLGSIAWTLWRKREPIVPLLAMERFRDLDARVRFSRDSIRVRLPLGRRFQDLHEHRLLDDVKDVPWLGGRTLQFSGG